MRKTALALIAVAGVAAVVGAPTASAFATRSSVHESNKVSNRQGTQGNQGSDQDSGDKGSNPNGSPTSVPEPGTLVLLAAGVTAIGGAALRRRRLKKE
jgi:hypothetical protein